MKTPDHSTTPSPATAASTDAASKKNRCMEQLDFQEFVTGMNARELDGFEWEMAARQEEANHGSKTGLWKSIDPDTRASLLADAAQMAAPVATDRHDTRE